MILRPIEGAEADAPVFYDAAIWPYGVLFEPSRNLALVEVWRTNALLRVDVYRVQSTQCNGIKVISSADFPVIRALIGRTGSAKISQMSPAAEDECTWALSAITQYRRSCNWDEAVQAGTEELSASHR